MNRCTKCNNELIAGARFCNVCGTPTSKVPAVSPIPKRTINPEVRRVQPARGNRPATTPLPDPSSLVQGKPVSLPAGLEASDPDKTVALPPPTIAPTQPAQSPAPKSGQAPAPGIIRPITPSSAPRQNPPVPQGQTPLNPVSPLPVVPGTPALSVEKAPQSNTANSSRSMNMPASDAGIPDTPRPVERPVQGQVAPRQLSQPDTNINAARQQSAFHANVPQTPMPTLHDMPTNYHEIQASNSNGVYNTSSRQELPLFSPESFAYTSKAAEHWRKSWRDLQNAEAGPAENVSKGQASVPAPLAARKDSFIRLRAIRSRQNQEAGEKNFGFWVTLFLMICLIGGLGAYIVYSYLPSTGGATRLNQPAGAQSPTFDTTSATSQVLVRGQSLRAHGEHFGANDTISFLLDNTTPVLASSGGTLSAQTDNQGTFDVTIPIGNNWAIGTHVITATDARASLSAYLDIQVNPGSSPVTAKNSPDLTFSLNGQSIDQLSFTAQIGQPAPPAQRITFTNTSNAPMQWTAAASTDNNLNWLNILDSDYSGQLDISQPHTMGISANPTGLPVTPAGKAPYSGQIVFTLNGNEQLTMRVQLTIIDATPEMVFSPNPLVATANANGTCKPGSTLTFINLGTTVVNWSAHPDLQNNIQFVDSRGVVTEHGTLQPSGMDGDTAVVTLRCNGVRAGDKYLVHVFANTTGYPEIVYIG